MTTTAVAALVVAGSLAGSLGGCTAGNSEPAWALHADRIEPATAAESLSHASRASWASARAARANPTDRTAAGDLYLARTGDGPAALDEDTGDVAR